ncbi:MAG: ThiF family adenylyltransferase [Phycisphaerales bacterium]|nr:ThiF family adenylyltransferase [Phycisphaerales bacterium]
MRPEADGFDRVGKFLVDSRELDPERALALLAATQVTVWAGEEIRGSSADQAFLLTLANLMPRVFKRPLRIQAAKGVLATKPLVPWPAASLDEALEVMGAESVEAGTPAGADVCLGGGDDGQYRAIHHGWCVDLAPPDWPSRLASGPSHALTGVAGAGLYLAEKFFDVCGVHAAALKRPVGLSLWRPDLAADDPAALGPSQAYLPAELWLMGLGHLGQAVLWAWSMLPYPDRSTVQILLQDFDRAIPANFGPQALMTHADTGHRKTWIAARFLEARGFDPGVVDRRVDERTRRDISEPALCIAAFDGRGPRWLLDDLCFDATVVVGVGGSASSFDDIEIHTLPLASGKAKEIWKPGAPNANAERLAESNAYYRRVREEKRCGDLELAGVSVAVPFVGAVTGTLAVADLIRIVSGGQQFAFHGLGLRSGEPGRHRTRDVALRPRLVSGFQQAHADA